MPHAKLSCELTPVDEKRLAILCGQTETHIKQIEQALKVTIHNRHHCFHIEGEEQAIRQAENTIQFLYKQTSHVTHFNAHDIHLALCSAHRTPLKKKDQRCITTQKRSILARSEQQATYMQAMEENIIQFAIGPSGTGKTFLAVAQAVHALEQQQVHRIILARPAVEAGENLGFLPGDLSQKVDPYLRPLYDALHAMLPAEDIKKLIERQLIEIAPLAYMRGRTLTEAFIILDEAQNTTQEQLKMFITRIGMKSRMVITGDLSQIDLPKSQQSGLCQVLDFLPQLTHIGLCVFDAHDVVRHPLLEQVIRAYEDYEKKQ